MRQEAARSSAGYGPCLRLRAESDRSRRADRRRLRCLVSPDSEAIAQFGSKAERTSPSSRHQGLSPTRRRKQTARTGRPRRRTPVLARSRSQGLDSPTVACGPHRISALPCCHPDPARSICRSLRAPASQAPPLSREPARRSDAFGRDPRSPSRSSLSSSTSPRRDVSFASKARAGSCRRSRVPCRDSDSAARRSGTSPSASAAPPRKGLVGRVGRDVRESTRQRRGRHRRTVAGPQRSAAGRSRARVSGLNRSG
jgi:hypothetical protein